jgi:hypothetical protein
MNTHDHSNELLAAQRFFLERSNAAYLWEAGSPELLYTYRVLRLLCNDPAMRRLQFYVTNEEPLPRSGNDVVVIQIGNEDHSIPDFTGDVLCVFTPYPPTGVAPRNLFAIPLGYNGRLPELPMRSFDDRTLDAFFSGQRRNDRWKIARAVEILAPAGADPRGIRVEYTERFGSGMAPGEYARCMMDARIAFAPAGTRSPVTFRFFEAARAGNAIISCPLPDTWYYRPFPGIQLDDWDELPALLDALLADHASLARMHAGMRWYYREFCSERATAAYMRRAINAALHSIGWREAAHASPIALEGMA